MLERAPRKRVPKAEQAPTLSPKKKVVTLESALEKKKRISKKKTEGGEELTIQEKKLIAQEKRQAKKMLTEGIEKKKRLKKSLEIKQETEPLENEEAFRGEGGSTIFTGPENLPVEGVTTTESVDYQRDIGEMGFDHIVKGKKSIPESFDSHEKDLIEEFGSADPYEVREEIAKRKDYTDPVANERLAQYGGAPETYVYDNHEHTHKIPLAYKDPIDEIIEYETTRPPLDPEYERYLSPEEIYDNIEPEEADPAFKLVDEEPKITPEELYAPLLPRAEKVEPVAKRGSLMSGPWNLLKRFNKWISGNKPDTFEFTKHVSGTEPERWALHQREGNRLDENKRTNYFEKFKSLEKRKDRDADAINKFVDEQHRSAVAREINENIYKQNLAADEREYEERIAQERAQEAKLIAAWEPYLKQRAAQDAVDQATYNADLRRTAEQASKQKQVEVTPTYEEVE